jgi:hypothetical protein
MLNRIAVAAALAIGLGTAGGSAVGPTFRSGDARAEARAYSRLAAQRGREGGTAEKPKVDIVQTVGCAERKSGNDPGGRGPRSERDTWWLVRAADPRVAPAGMFSSTQIEAAKNAAPGTQIFQLIGVADFLDTEGLLGSGQRKEFTTPETANATGALRQGHKVLVKGLLIDTETPNRINLLAVIGLADMCG